MIAGDQDPVYSETLFRETAEGIPNAKLILYAGKGHAPVGKQFERDVLDFLTEDITKTFKTSEANIKSAK